jgi:TolB-like protein/DNA-binding winged helix-turn-helix (wHTH) protein
MGMTESQRILRFGIFELDLRSRELRKNGSKVKLQNQPFVILAALLEKPGDLLTREELRRRIWSADTFVDFDIGLNTAITRLRHALGDAAENPRFVETLPGRGYRFIASVDSSGERLISVPAAVGVAPQAPVVGGDIHAGEKSKTPATGTLRPSRRQMMIGILALAAVVALAAGLQISPLRDRLFGKPDSTRIQSLAVLPLKNLSNDPEKDYFADGMTEMLITELGKVSGLRVISHTSVTRYKDTKIALGEIARELRVDALIEGTVARSGDRVRITANLIQASPETHLWAQSYERDLGDLLALQSDVAQAIATHISIAMRPRDRVRLTSAHSINPEAYELYLRGRYFYNRRTTENLKKAAQYFQRAIDQDPEFALAYAGLGISYGAEVFRGRRPSEVMPKAKALVSKALEIDESIGEVHSSLASLRMRYDLDWAGAEREFRQAIELNPNDADAHQFFGNYLVLTGQFDKARAEQQLAHELDPLSVFHTTVSCLNYYLMREENRAIEECRKALEMDADFITAHENLAAIYEYNRMYAQSFRELEKAMTLRKEDSRVIEALRTGYDASGMKGLWRKQIELGKEISKQQYVDPVGMVFAYANLGEKEQALTWLQTAYDERSPGMASLKVDPRFDPLRSDPRFQALLRRIGLMP